MEKTFERYYGEHYKMAIFLMGWVDFFLSPTGRSKAAQQQPRWVGNLMTDTPSRPA